MRLQARRDGLEIVSWAATLTQGKGGGSGRKGGGVNVGRVVVELKVGSQQARFGSKDTNGELSSRLSDLEGSRGGLIPRPSRRRRSAWRCKPKWPDDTDTRDGGLGWGGAGYGQRQHK